MADRAAQPPMKLANRVGSVRDFDDPRESYERFGRDCKQQILRMLPDGWGLEGRRLLDFGCGAGRTLRYFLEEAEWAEVWGCDIDAASIEWLSRELSPPLRVFRSGERPPLPLEDGSIDLVWALSVFTHLADDWAEWLLELRRVLADDGLLIATFQGERVSWDVADEDWDPDRIGMNVLDYTNDWDHGGPTVLHSEWWVRAHWGRAFEIEAIEFPGPDLPFGLSLQSWALMRKRAGAIEPDALTAPEPDEPRELRAAQHSVRQLQRRSVAASNFESTLSWRITRPLRAAGRLARRLRPRRGPDGG